MKYVRAEYIKYKHTMLNKLLLIAPLLTVIFAFLMAGVLNFQSIAIYWWYAFILQGMIAVLCLLSRRSEEVSGNHLIIYSLPVNLQKIKMANHLVLVGKLFVAQMVCMLLIQVFPMLLFPDYSTYGFGQLLLANIVLVLTTMWQIPLCFIMMRFLGKMGAVFVNVVLGMFTMVAMGNTRYWIVCPYCYSAKAMEGMLNIKINGVLSETTLNYSTMHLQAMILAVVLFWLLANLDAYFYEKERR